MLVDLTCLRREGVKIPREALPGAPTLRGNFRMDTPAGVIRRYVGPKVAHFYDATALEVLRPPLDEARITKRRGSAFLVAGFETIHERRGSVRFPQVWWCRLVLPAPAPPSDPRKRESTAAEPALP